VSELNIGKELTSQLQYIQRHVPRGQLALIVLEGKWYQWQPTSEYSAWI